MGKVGKFFSGIFGGGPKIVVQQPAVQEPAPVEREKPTADPSLDPNRSEAVAEARRRRLVLAQRSGRSALKVSLDEDGSMRSGISIR